MNGTNIKFMTINANGVSTDRRLELLQLMKEENLSAMLIQETKERRVSHPNYHAKLESSNDFIVLKCNTNSDQAKHGVAVMIDRAALASNTEPEIVYKCNNGRTLIVQFDDKHGNHIVLASLYFPVDDPRARMSHMRCLPWTLLAGCLNAGDLNLLTNVREHRSNNNAEPQALGDDSHVFLEYINTHQLVDLFDVFYDDDEHPVTRVGYANQRDATLDRWFVPMTVAALAMACDVRPTTSDHHAVVASFTSPQHSHSSRPRRVRTMPVEFLKQPPILAAYKREVLFSFRSMLSSNTNTTTHFTLLMEETHRWLGAERERSEREQRKRTRRNLRERLRQLNKRRHSARHQRDVSALHARIAVVERSLLDIDRLVRDKQRLEQQRSRYKSLLSSRKLFQMRMSSQQGNLLPCLIDEHGVEQRDDTVMAQIAADYFAGQFVDHPDPDDDGLSGADALDDVLNCVPDCADQTSRMSCDLSVSDLQRAVAKSNKQSSPGVDGVPYNLFVYVPELLVDLCRVWANRYRFGVPPSFRQVLFSPVHKRGDKRTISNYRPIGLESCIRKIITLAINDRLSKLIPKIINDDQTAFVSGRTIFDGLARLLAAADVCRNHPARRQTPLCILSYDFSRAYDTVKHDYVISVLKKFGFNQNFLTDIVFLLQNMTGRVVLNGRLTDAFPLDAGLIQGDALSCSLYILCVSPLRALAERRGALGFTFDAGLPSIHTWYCTQYVDDLEVFADNRRDIDVWNDVLRLYGLASGNKLNARKCRATICNDLHNEFAALPAPFNTPDSVVKDADDIRKLGFRFDASGGIHSSAWSRALAQSRAAATRWRYVDVDMEMRARVVVTDVLAPALFLAPLVPCPDKVANQFDEIALSTFVVNGKPPALRPRREFLANQQVIGGLLRNGIGQMRDLAAGRLAGFYWKAVVKQRKLDMKENNTSVNPVLLIANFAHQRKVGTRHRLPLVSAVPPGRQPVIGVQQSNVQRNDTAYNPLLVAKRQFAAAVLHNVDASLAVPRRFKRDVILSQRLYNNRWFKHDLKINDSVVTKQLPWCLRVGDVLNHQQNVRRNVRETIIGKLVDQSLLDYDWKLTLDGRIAENEPTLADFSPGNFVLDQLADASRPFDRRSIWQIVRLSTSIANNLVLRKTPWTINEKWSKTKHLLWSRQHTTQIMKRLPIHDCCRVIVANSNRLVMIGDSDIDVNNVAVFFDEPHLELAVLERVKRLSTQQQPTQNKRLLYQQRAHLELDTASSRRCVSENHQLLKKRQLCGADYANKTKVLVARYRSLNRKMTQIPSVRRPDDPTTNTTRHFSFDDLNKINIDGQLKNWTYLMLHNKLAFGAAVNMLICPMCGSSTLPIDNRDHIVRDCAFALKVRDLLFTDHFVQLVNSSVTRAAFNDAWELQLRVRTAASRALAACVLMAKRALQTDSMRRFHALHQPSPLPTAADASLLAKRIYLQWRKAARVGSRIVRSVMSSLPLQAVHERKRLLKFCDEQWFKFMPDPSSASWPD